MEKNMIQKYVIFFLVLVVSLSLFNYESQAQRKGKRDTKPKLSISEQADNFAKTYWAKRIVRCGDSYYTWERDNIDGLILVEMKNVIIQTIGKPPRSPQTQAQILNEKENPSTLKWSGESVISTTAFRKMLQSTRTWGSWADSNYSIFFTIQNNNGVWTISPSNPIPISCSEVDTFTLKSSSIIPPSISEDGITLNFPANYPYRFSIGKGPLTLMMPNPYPQIYVKRGAQGETPNDNTRGYLDWQHNANALVPNIKLGALVAQIGTAGEFFAPFNDDLTRKPYYQNGKYLNSFIQYRFETNEEIWLAINDYDYTDNRGAFKFFIVDRSIESDSSTTNSVNTTERPLVFRATKEQIIQVQKIFKEKSVFNVEVTGKYDESFRVAIKSYQMNNGLVPTGTLNRITLEKLGIPLTNKQKEIPK